MIQHVKFSFKPYQPHINAKIVSLKSMLLNNLFLYLKKVPLC